MTTPRVSSVLRPDGPVPSPARAPGETLVASPRQPHRTRTPQLRALDADWAHARRRPANIRRVRTWPGLVADHRAAQALDTAVRSITDLEQLVASTNRRGGPSAIGAPIDPDEVLGALIEVARTDELAARVVLQRIVPGLISASRRYARSVFNDDRIDLAIGAAWLTIRTFDIERRRRHVAATLVSDVMWSAFQRPSRRKSIREIPTPNEVFARTAAAPIELDAVTALAGTVRAAATAGIDDGALELIRELARVGSPGEVARRRNVTPRTIRNQRNTATSLIRAALGPDWADWRDQLVAAA